MRRFFIAFVISGCTADVVFEGDAGVVDTGAGTDSGVIDAGDGTPDAGFDLITIPPADQRSGDPAAGYTALVNGDYVGCGVPYSAYAQVSQPAPMNRRLSGRTGNNETLPYDFNAFTTASGVEVVAATCLACHAAVFEGEVVMGLGDANRDFTNDPSQAAEAAGFLVTDPMERVEWRKWADRMQATGPYITTPVIGVNPADNLAAILFSHRDPTTLAWSDTPILEPPPVQPLPVDVPPWWRVKKKNALYYTASGRGDHARLMMTASVLCVDDVSVAADIDSYFPDVRAYLDTVEAPEYPQSVDATMASEGEDIFLATCSRCHGTYGEGGSYPNFVVSLDEVGTDPWLVMAGFSTEIYQDWFASSFYGEVASLDPAPGYIAPPLDGIWLTAPYLHNGSVPTIRALLDSSLRPTYFTRSFTGSGYDYDDLGWPFTVEDHGHATETNPNRKKQIYDTTLPGYSNLGHTFGDDLTADERDAVIEYLKTL